jgi:hypothetical protein
MSAQGRGHGTRRGANPRVPASPSLFDSVTLQSENVLAARGRRMASAALVSLNAERKTAMKKVILAAAVLLALVVSGCATAPRGKCCAGGAGKCVCPAKVLRHVVLLKFKEGTTPEQVKEIETAFAALPGKVKEIACFEWGTDISPEKKAEGFTHCFLVTFRSEADRDAYLPHAAHNEFKSIAGPHIEKVIVVDYWAKR